MTNWKQVTASTHPKWTGPPVASLEPLRYITDNEDYETTDQMTSLTTEKLDEATQPGGDTVYKTVTAQNNPTYTVADPANSPTWTTVTAPTGTTWTADDN